MLHPKVYPLIFTDLDGTLLNHDTYSASPADALIKHLHDSEIARVIPVTSKTQTELSWLNRSIPFGNSVQIAENGSIVCAPFGFPFSEKPVSEILILGVPYPAILAAVAALPSPLRQHVNGFNYMDAAKVAQLTGLSPNDAQRAKERQATEPFLWSGTENDMDALKQHMTQAGIQVQQGGRFFHFTGRATKEQAMQRVVAAYRQRQPDSSIVTIALGDGPNDLKMIEAADYGVIIPNTEGAAIKSALPTVHTAEKPGPEGWALSVSQILQKLGLL